MINDNKHSLIGSVIVIVFLIIFSEMIYWFVNPNLKEPDYYIRKMSAYSRKEDNKKLLESFQKATLSRWNQVKDINESWKDVEPYPIDRTLDEGLQVKIVEYLSKVDYEELEASFPNLMGRLYYNIAIDFFESGETSIALEFFKNAVYMSPRWSHFHVVLANYFLQSGDLENATKAIDVCMNFEEARSHCDQFKSDVFPNPVSIGYLGDVINGKYYIGIGVSLDTVNDSLIKLSSIVERGDFSDAFMVLDEAANSRHLEVKNEFGGIYYDKVIYPTKYDEQPEELKEKLAEYLDSRDFNLLQKTYGASIGKIYYNFGIIFHEFGDINKSEEMFKNARILAPDWSHFHLVLANFYFNSGDVDGMEESLELCKKISSAKNSCEEFSPNNGKENLKYDFLSESIETGIVDSL
ncbi:tetratricopeptide repeat protein [Patescibacteria group bacterium]